MFWAISSPGLSAVTPGSTLSGLAASSIVSTDGNEVDDVTSVETVEDDEGTELVEEDEGVELDELVVVVVFDEDELRATYAATTATTKTTTITTAVTGREIPETLDVRTLSSVDERYLAIWPERLTVARLPKILGKSYRCGCK